MVRIVPIITQWVTCLSVKLRACSDLGSDLEEDMLGSAAQSHP